MSFLDIKDAKRRDAIVSEYLELRKRMKHQNIENRTQDFARQEDLRQMFEPVVESTGKSAEVIANKLAPIHEGIKTMNEKMNNVIAATQQHPQEPDGGEPINMYGEYIQKYGGRSSNALDKYYGIHSDGPHQYTIGNKNLTITEHSDLILDGRKYKATVGLWALIMLNRPENIYSSDDLNTYRDIIIQSNAATSVPHDVAHYARRTYKWTDILSKLLHTPQSEAHESEEEIRQGYHIAENTASRDVPSSGDGIQFLPSDIKGLQTKLGYLLGEYRAGNRSSLTYNQIVSILDELLRRKRLSRSEYRDINTFIQQQQ